MREQTRGRSFRVPDFGRVVPRRFLKALHAVDSGIIVFLAPGGHGKSVTCAQFASSEKFDEAIWIDASGQELGEEVVLGILLTDYFGLPEGSLGRGDSALLPTVTTAELWTHLDERFDSFEGRSVCLVIDNLVVPKKCDFIPRLADRLRVGTDRSSRLLVSCRGLRADIAKSLGDVTIVEPTDLMLSFEEAKELVIDVYGAQATDDQVRSLSETCSGQPAVLSVLARHAAMRGVGCVIDGSVPLDLRSNLESVAFTQLGEASRRALFVCSILGSGTVAEVEEILQGACAFDAVKLAECIPLLRLSGARSNRGRTFIIHDLAQSIFLDEGFGDSIGAERSKLWKRALARLGTRGDHARVFDVVLRWGSCQDLTLWLERVGSVLLDLGYMNLLKQCLDALPLSILVARPRILILQASAVMETGQFSEAVKKATVACELAEHEGDSGSVRDALILLAAIHNTAGNAHASRECLDRVLRISPEQLTPNVLALVNSSLSMCLSLLGEYRESEKHAQEALSSSGLVDGYVKARVMHANGVLRGLSGRWDLATESFSRCRVSQDVPVGPSLLAIGNLATALCEMGRTSRGLEAVEVAVAACRTSEMLPMHYAFLGTRAGLSAAEGDFSLSDSQMSESIAGSLDLDDQFTAYFDMLYRSTIRRAFGDFDSALSDAERASEYYGGSESKVAVWLASLELAASLLALGDESAAERRVEPIRAEAASAGALYHALRADMILSEIERLRGRAAQAVMRLSAQEEYILTESSNWQIAMYTRAFPGLLGIFAEALGPERMPSHLLRLLRKGDVERAVGMARDVMDDEALSELAARLGQAAQSSSITTGEDGEPTCRVRLFGGLDVRVAGRTVNDADWGKRKARSLFVYLATRRGRDAPRDQILETLWPEMDERRARNNFYVVWSSMKGALMGTAGKVGKCPFLENTNGMCRTIPGLVVTDLDVFDGHVAEARKAESVGDARVALEAYQRASEVYTGELLPADLYDDWLQPIREHYRQEAGDVMLAMARICEEGGEIERALAHVRRAIANDPWREDLFQALLRYQIATGQRSAAIETFMACRRRLSEDLGLDPAVETKRLYEQVLAMEDESFFDSHSAGGQEPVSP